ncbi:LysE family translocator [Lutibaculum baratangense]|uniref:Putative transporter, LysE family n=1 Tax=Lutibaculum baratangense AMV1 TaxID=631454 RepID=V4RMV4_9HYPH|nr:LysE family translocator [Lutibaculum baratangense]ESR27356.1 putative transporter, LysE family [Lutibaculum baratangense AMV1]
MPLHTWLLFLPAVFAINVYPGPNNLMALGNGARRGGRQAFLAAAARLPAFAAMIALVALGLGVVLAASETFFVVLKWIGAAYLVYLGIRMMLAPVDEAAVGRAPAEPLARLARREFLVAATNPKAIVTFTAFFPQFLTPGGEHYVEMAQMGLAFLLLEAVAILIYAGLGSRIGALAGTARRMRLVNRLSGGALVVAGALLALARRPQAV